MKEKIIEYLKRYIIRRRFLCNNVYLVIILLAIVSCGRKNDTMLEEALKAAGDNRAELEAVLTHYEDDKLKLESAGYLISNMSGLYSYDKRITELCSPFYDQYDSIAKKYDHEKNIERGREVDSLWNLFRSGNPGLYKFPVQADLRNITAGQLIAEIDLAFDAWQGNIYTRGGSFEEFCEYILPYRRVQGLHIDDARKTFHERHRGDYFTAPGRDMIDEADSLLYRYRHIDYSNRWTPRMPVHSAATLERVLLGTCEHRCWYNSLLFSSLGMAVAIDFVPVWGNRNNGHSWNVLVRDGESYPFEPYWDNDRWKYKRIYNNETFDHINGRFRLAKVYRHTYREHADGPVADKKVKRADIPNFFTNTRKKDVSHEYFEVVDVPVQLKDVPEDARYAYLCVSAYYHWSPVQWGRIERGGTAVFRGMGKDIVYLACYYENGELLPAGEPFLLNREGRVETFRTDTGDTGEICIKNYTGAPQHQRNNLNNINIRGTTILGSLAPSFSGSDTIAILPDTIELYNKRIDSRSGAPARYLRVSLPQRVLSFSNLAFYCRNGEGEEVKIETPVLVHPLDSTENGEITSYMFDRYIATGYQRELEKDYVDIDLGGEYVISSLCYAPYLFCGLKEEETYELSYWDGGWQYLDRRQGSGKHLIFKNVPRGALLQLRFQDTGKRPETRPFIYQENEVRWY